MHPDPQESKPAGPEDPVCWLDQYGNYLFAYAVSRLPDREVAEDLVQETFLAAVQSAHRFEQRSSIQTWLVGILRKKIVDFFRRNRRVQVAQGLDTMVEPMPDEFDSRGVWSRQLSRWPDDPARVLVEREFWIAFDECRKKLPPRLFAAFTLRDIDQQETEAICAELEITTSNLGVRLHRARMMLRQCLEKHFIGEPR